MRRRTLQRQTADADRIAAGPGIGGWGLLVASLLVVLIAFRVEKIAVAGLRLTGLDWWVLVAPEIGLALVLFGVGVLLSGWIGSRRWALPGLALVLAVAAFAAVQHAFFLRAGYRLDPELAGYALRNLGMLGGLLDAAVDRRIAVRLAVAFGCPVLCWLLVRRRGSGSGDGSVRVRVLAVGLVLVGALLLGVPSRHHGAVASLAENDLVAFVGSLFDRGGHYDLDPYLVEPSEFYREPRFVGVEGERPNLLLVVLESTGANVSPPWSISEDLPALRTFAAESTVVRNTATVVSHTSKALVAMLCGMVPRLGVEILEAEPGGLPLPCLPRLLGEAGYRTGFLQTATAEWENRPGLVANLGFDSGAYQETLQREGFDEVGFLGIDEFAMLDPALAWMRSDPTTPFFATLLTLTPHFPYNGPGRSERLALEEPRREYSESLRHQDRFLGALLGRLEIAGLDRNTIVILIGDHGEAFGEHLRKEHDAVPYQEVVHVPWWMRGPDGPVRGRSSIAGNRTQLDLLPTVLDLAGVRWEGRLPGRSVFGDGGHEEVYSWCWGNRVCGALRRGDRKLVSHFGRRPPEMYELGDDPLERDDLARRAGDLREFEARFLARTLTVGAFWGTRPTSDGRQ